MSDGNIHPAISGALDVMRWARIAAPTKARADQIDAAIARLQETIARSSVETRPLAWQPQGTADITFGTERVMVLRWDASDGSGA